MKKAGGKPQADEFYCYDESGAKIPGKYDSSGAFIVAASHRVSCKVDSNGFLMSSNGKAMINSKIKDRMKKRELKAGAGGKPQADEFYCYDESGVKIPGKYNSSGAFIVAESHKGSCKVDA